MSAATLKVTPIASTHLTDSYYGLVKEIGYEQETWLPDGDALSEFAGRACYQSWDKPNPATATNEGYMANILSQGHFSVLEHSSVTFYVEGVSRSLTHELVRHRHLSFSQLSQRYVAAEDANYVIPPALEGVDANLETEFDLALNLYEGFVHYLVDGKGLPRKKAREAARAVLPNMTETKLVVTGNLRAWRDVLHKRYHVAADAEIQRFAVEVLRHLRNLAPNSFQDFPEQPFGSQV